MRQMEIQYFFPLTEQIPLDLIYEGCEKPKLTVCNENNITFTTRWDTSTVSITASHLNLDIDTTTIKVKESPNLCRRVLYKCMGFKWEKK
jgi:hypothetical protein